MNKSVVEEVGCEVGPERAKGVEGWFVEIDDDVKEAEHYVVGEDDGCVVDGVWVGEVEEFECDVVVFGRSGNVEGET